MLKLLLDENLSLRAVRALRAEGYDIVHVQERSALGASDPVILELAFVEDRVLVTANIGDFRKLALAREVHPGLVLVENGAMRHEAQVALLRQILPEIVALGDLVNRAVNVGMDGRLTVETLARTGS